MKSFEYAQNIRCYKEMKNWTAFENTNEVLQLTYKRSN